MPEPYTPIRSVGIIMDGNRRWAKSRGLPVFSGHQKGVEALKKLFDEYPRLKNEYGLAAISLYAFSTENWDRAQEELGFLMQLFEKALGDLLESFSKDETPEKKVRIRIIGQRERFSTKLQKIMRELEEKTATYEAGDVYIALSYGGRSEILGAVNSLLSEGVSEVSEKDFAGRLWTRGMPDPDIIIRTGGAKRLSNFLPWQSVYSELFFTDTLWPDFAVKELEAIFKEFQSRERRHGR
ncbi:MAG: di-trans,poly-cis-decaprenylcistransferase [Patescibacteria group bacterium]|nr:di-trans,poly-cis-decaprenylcistransferase [Patescibacteria group bacterium]